MLTPAFLITVDLSTYFVHPSGRISTVHPLRKKADSPAYLHICYIYIHASAASSKSLRQSEKLHIPGQKSKMSSTDACSKFIEHIDRPYYTSYHKESACDVRLEDVLAAHNAMVERRRSSTLSSSDSSLGSSNSNSSSPSTSSATAAAASSERWKKKVENLLRRDG